MRREQSWPYLAVHTTQGRGLSASPACSLCALAVAGQDSSSSKQHSMGIASPALIALAEALDALAVAHALVHAELRAGRRG